MRRWRRRAFADVVGRQLDLFAREHAELLDECDAALRAYDRAAADEAEERYGDYVDATDAAREVLEELRDAYATTLDDATADAYRAAFDEAVSKRFPSSGTGGQ